MLAKINALLACSQMLAKTIRYPFYREGKRESWDWTRGSRNRASKKSGYLCMINETSGALVGWVSDNIPSTGKIMCVLTWSGHHRRDLTWPIKGWNFNVFYKVICSDSWSLLILKIMKDYWYHSYSFFVSFSAADMGLTFETSTVVILILHC